MFNLSPNPVFSRHPNRFQLECSGILTLATGFEFKFQNQHSTKHKSYVFIFAKHTRRNSSNSTSSSKLWYESRINEARSCSVRFSPTCFILDIFAGKSASVRRAFSLLIVMNCKYNRNQIITLLQLYRFKKQIKEIDDIGVKNRENENFRRLTWDFKLRSSTCVNWFWSHGSDTKIPTYPAISNESLSLISLSGLLNTRWLPISLSLSLLLSF